MKDKVLIVFLLTFSCVADLLVLVLIPGYHSLNLAITFIQLGGIFMLQHKFKLVRAMLLICLSLLGVYNGWKLVVTLDMITVSNFINQSILVPSTYPLYACLMLFGLMIYGFLRNYDLTR